MYSKSEIYEESCVEDCKREAIIIAYRDYDFERIKELSCSLIGVIAAKPYAPDFYGHITGVYLEDSLNCIKVTLKLKKSYAEDGDACKRTMLLLWGENYFENLMRFVGEWVDAYRVRAKLKQNARELTECINSFGSPIHFEFEYGSKLKSLTNSSITIGLDEETLANLTEWGLWGKDTTLKYYAEKALKEAILSIARPVDLIRLNTPVIRRFNVRTRVRLNKLLTLYKPLCAGQENTVCKVTQGDYIALLKKVPKNAVQEEEKADVIYTDADYSYVTVLDPLGEKDVPLFDREQYVNMVKGAVTGGEP